ncbi:MAG TPA: serine/threonine-protein kinase [Anaerolineae bacterium]|nr:serine/threonine-protein kinase [Anaerolineae bacterium]
MSSTVPCPNCHTLNRPTAQFCVQCRTRMPGSTGRLPPNTFLQNRFIIVKTIGGGGMGAVYLATDAQLTGQRWAIKEMSLSQLDALEIPKAIEGFQQEAELLKKLHHPNLPKAQPAFEQNGRWYFVMEFIEGQNLLDLLVTRGTPFDESQILDWARQLCDVLEYLHTQNPPIIFRDLKPANIMVEPSGRLKLIDFGIARFFKAGQTRDTISMGSHDYAALEQFGSGQTDARSDIHAFGATLYHLLTGEPPPKANERALDPNLLKPVRHENPNVSVRTSDVIAKALAVHPSQRYQSVREMRAALFSSPPLLSAVRRTRNPLPRPFQARSHTPHRPLRFPKSKPVRLKPISTH